MSSGFGDKKGLTFPLDKILFMIACFYLGLVVSWLFYQGRSASNAPLETVSQPPVLSPSQKQFIGYMRESLRQIDRKAKTPAPEAATLPGATVAVPPPPPQVTTGPQEKIIERIYVPIYPGTAPKVQPSPVKTAVIPPPPPVSIPTPPPLPSTASIPSLVKGENTLVGVLELGGQSAALFQSTQMTRRVAIGESINGWILVAVRDQKVILSRGGQQRSLEVGQKFD